MNNPMTPNPDQLPFIHPANDPATNPARYEEPTGEPKIPQPTIIVPADAVYLVEPGLEEEPPV